MNEVLLLEIKQSLEELNEKIMITKQEVFNAREAAKYLRIGYDTVLRETKVGEIEFVPNGTSYLYKKEFLDNWLEKHRKFAR